MASALAALPSLLKSRAALAGIVAAATLASLAVAVPLLSAAEKPAVVARVDWKAKPARTELMKRQSLLEIVIHHTSTKQSPRRSLEDKLRSLQGFSQREEPMGKRLKPAWGDVPYHFYIDVSGRIGEGRSLEFAGDTNTQYDTSNKIQIVVEGAFETEEPTKEQLAALRRLVVWLAAEHKIPGERISAHNDHARTDCPGRNLKPFLRVLKDAVAQRNGSR